MVSAELTGFHLATGVLLLVFSTGLSLLFTVPFLGALVRFRAHFTPRGLQLDTEGGGVQPHVGPVVSSYWAMLFRVKRIEGWSGMYKGTMPMMISSTFITLFGAIYLGASMARVGHQYRVPEGSSLEILVFGGFLTILTIPFTVLINRAITTPHKLKWFSPMQSLRILLTPYERTRPWMLYTAPGLLLSRVLHIVWIILVQRGARMVLIPDFATSPVSNIGDSPSDRNNPFESISAARLTVYLFFTALTHPLILTPLEVISVRLSIQRNHATGEGFSSVPPEEVVVEEETEYAGANEDVIALRPEDDPYVGFVDCGKRIVSEEGYGALYRAWWVTLLAGLVGAFA